MAVTAAAVAVLLAPVAHAAPAGDNGNVKIHDAKTDEWLKKNEPHVCTFYLDGFQFDSAQQVTWRIEAWAPTADVKGTEVKSGSLKLDGSGHERTEVLSLADGHYKLFWNFDGEHGRAKHKVFWVDCPDGSTPGQPGATPSGTTSVTPSGSTTVSPSVSPSGSPSGKPSSSPSVQPSGSAVSPSPSGSDAATTGGDLAKTGSDTPVGLLAGVAGVLIAGGAFLVMRRRKAGAEG
ncbi:LPXTG cell wall anchor domain-containing protein [Streptomyces sp. ISL-66]|uniref:LPXTG cell wall anchor domain-containing protein n=1 Tax=Streptomyces sp. ISL-66 TaxID=2819186 RepID=UPI0035B0ED3D